MNLNFKEYKIWIETALATIHSFKMDNYNYITLFNIEEHRNFVNDYKAFGFYTHISNLGEEKTDFVPIGLPDKTLLTTEIMESIWNEMKSQGLPD